MGSNATSALKVAAGIFLTIALITIVVLLFVHAADATKEGGSRFSEIKTELSDTTYTMYDGGTLSGSQVVNAIRKFKDTDQFGVFVETGKGGRTYYGYPFDQKTGEITSKDPLSDISPALSEKDNTYVNPNGKFKSSIVRDQSNVIRGIIFVQN